MYLCSKYYISTDQNSNYLGEAGDEHEALRQQSHTHKKKNIQSINAIHNFGTSPKDQDYAQREKDSVVSIIYTGFCKFQCDKESISQMKGGMMMGAKVQNDKLKGLLDHMAHFRDLSEQAYY